MSFDPSDYTGPKLSAEKRAQRASQRSVEDSLAAEWAREHTCTVAGCNWTAVDVSACRHCEEPTCAKHLEGGLCGPCREAIRWDREQLAATERDAAPVWKDCTVCKHPIKRGACPVCHASERLNWGPK